LSCGALTLNFGLIAPRAGLQAFSQLRCALPSLAFTLRGRALTYVGAQLAFIGNPLALISDPIPFIGDPIAFIRDPVAPREIFLAPCDGLFALGELGGPAILFSWRDAIMPCDHDSIPGLPERASQIRLVGAVD
jgi:hypothetical protein